MLENMQLSFLPPLHLDDECQWGQPLEPWSYLTWKDKGKYS